MSQPVLEAANKEAPCGFLSLCRVVRDPGNPMRFAGDSDPLRYRDWSEAGPLLLVVETLNQFAVKAARIVHGGHALMVPAQLRELALDEIADYPQLVLAGIVAQHGDGYRVDVSARNRAETSYRPVASGRVFVAVLPAVTPRNIAQGART